MTQHRISRRSAATSRTTVYDVLRDHPAGITAAQIKAILQPPGLAGRCVVSHHLTALFRQGFASRVAITANKARTFLYQPNAATMTANTIRATILRAIEASPGLTTDQLAAAVISEHPSKTKTQVRNNIESAKTAGILRNTTEKNGARNTIARWYLNDGSDMLTFPNEESATASPPRSPLKPKPANHDEMRENFAAAMNLLVRAHPKLGGAEADATIDAAIVLLKTCRA